MKLTNNLIKRGALTGIIICASFAVNASEAYKFGLIPQQGASKLSKVWTPFFEYLEEKTGHDFQFATARNIPTYEKRLLAGKYDFAYMSPYHYVKYQELSGYNAFAKAKKKRLKGIIVVQKDSPYNTIEDLNDTEMAFPSNAFAANRVPRAILNSADVEYEPKFVASHDSVYRNVSKGRYPAGGGVMRTYRNTSPEYRNKLRILWTSDGYTPHAFAAHPRVPQNVIEDVQRAMLEMEKDTKGAAILRTIRLKGIEAGEDYEWDDVRALKIES